MVPPKKGRYSVYKGYATHYKSHSSKRIDIFFGKYSMKNFEI